MYKIYDTQKIGNYIASGTMHRVYRYGESRVIKFCFIAYPKKSPLRTRIKNDWDVVSRYFGEYTLPTQCVVNAKNNKFAEIQPFVTGRYLRKKDLADKEIKEQFEEILEIQKALQKEHDCQVDLIGHTGFLGGFLGNIYIQDNGKLILFDGSLLTMKGFTGIFYLYYPVVWIATKRQDQIIKKYTK